MIMDSILKIIKYIESIVMLIVIEKNLPNLHIDNKWILCFCLIIHDFKTIVFLFKE
jgi:hypothetical protein